MRPATVAAAMPIKKQPTTPNVGSSLAATTPQRMSIAPADRSNSPEIVTNVSAHARMPIGAAFSRTLRMLSFVRKTSLANVSTMHATITTTTIMYSRMTPNAAAAGLFLPPGPGGAAAAPAVAVTGCSSSIRDTSVTRGACARPSEGGAHDRFLLGGVPLELRHDAARADDEHAVRESQDLLDLARDHQDRHAVLSEPFQQFVDRLLGAHVDAACRLVGD